MNRSAGLWRFLEAEFNPGTRLSCTLSRSKGCVIHDDIVNTQFAKKLQSRDATMNDASRRAFVFAYLTEYQNIYWFDQLESAFAFLELCNCQPLLLPDELPSVRDEVAMAMGEYFESLNHVATAVNRLLDTNHFLFDDVTSCIVNVWNAHACNEPLEDFICREDAVLCRLLDSTAT